MNLPVKRQDTNLELQKTKSIFDIAKKLLGSSSDLVDDSWMQRLWDWADANEIPDLAWIGTEEDGYWQGLPQNKNKLMTFTCLNLSYVENIPEELWNLRNLKCLKYDGEGLSEKIQNLKKLENLSISGFDDKLPNGIWSLINLKKLELSFFESLVINTEIENLTNLEYLDLSANNIDDLPDEIWNLENLKKLDISSTNIKKLSNNISKLKNLTELSLDIDLTLGLENKIKKLDKLTKLNIYIDKKNCLQKIKNFSNFNNLELSILSSVNLPKVIFRQENIIELSFLSDTLKILPDEIGMLINLKTLDVGYNKLTDLPKEIGKLKKLENLNISCNDIYNLPNSIWKLDNIIDLILSNIGLEELSTQIYNLSKLEFLDLSANYLDELPSEIGSLIKLKHLDLSYNDFSVFPSEIENLINLKTLNIEGCEYLVLTKNQKGWIRTLRNRGSQIEMDKDLFDR